MRWKDIRPELTFFWISQINFYWSANNVRPRMDSPIEPPAVKSLVNKFCCNTITILHKLTVSIFGSSIYSSLRKTQHKISFQTLVLSTSYSKHPNAFLFSFCIFPLPVVFKNWERSEWIRRFKKIFLLSKKLAPFLLHSLFHFLRKNYNTYCSSTE